MARSSGTMSIPYPDFVNGTTADADQIDANNTDIVNEITNSIAADGQTTPTANLPMGTYRHTGVGNASARTHYAAAGQIADGALTWAGTAGGTADALTLALSPAITAYATNMRIGFKAGASNNTGAVTVAVNGLTTKAIESNGSALAADAIVASKYYEIFYDGTAFQLTRLGTNVAASGLTDPMTTRGDILVRNSSNATARLAVGAAGTALYSDGTDPSWTGIIKQGTHTIFVPAGAMRPTTSNGCAALAATETTAGRPDLIGLAFDASSDEHAQFQISFPKSWNEGTVTFRAWWWSTAADTDGVAWGLQGVACSDGDTADVAYGTAVVVTDAAQSTTEDVYVTDISSAVTIAGTPAAGDICFFRVFRDVSDAADTAAEDCILLGVQILFTLNSADDS